MASQKFGFVTVDPVSGSGDQAVNFSGDKHTGQEGCRQAYITSDGKRWLTSDNRVYGVLKSDAPCECIGDCP